MMTPTIEEANESGCRWRVWCRVSGGVTGTREAWLKNGNGVIEEFDTREEAQAVASRLNATMGRNSAVSFYYTVREA